MKVLLRLLRISLLLRLIPSLLSVIALTFSANAADTWLLSLNVLPALIVLALSYWLERRGQIQPRIVRRLLFAALFLQMVEFVLGSVLFLLAINGNKLNAEAMTRIRSSPDFSDLGVAFLLSLVPVVLGAWLDGRRGVLRWVGAAVILSAISLAIVVTIDRQLAVNLYSWQGLIRNTIAYLIVMTVVCFFVGSLADQQRAEHAQLEQANVRLNEQTHVREQLVANQERMRLSRDLHDTIAHTLAALSVQLNAVNAVLTGEQPAARHELSKARNLVKEGLDSTRQAIGDLRANPVADFGLVGALQKLNEAFTQRTAVPVYMQQTGETNTLGPEIANTLYRVAQEALNNVERHAHANEVHMQLTLRPKGDATHATLSIADNGLGFTQSTLEDERFGLKGMRERADLIGAHLRVDSALGKGTTVTVQV